jgi:hypothetical protein
MREIKADPCDASGRWARSSKLTGQHQPPNDDPPSVAGVVPTRRSGYTGGGWRAPPPPPKPHRPAPPPPEKENYRVAPTRSGPYVDGANVLSSQIRMGIDEAEAPEWRKPPQLVPKVMHPRRTPSGYANGHAVHAPDVDPDADSGRWQRESIGQRRAPPALPTAPPFGSVRPSESGFTHEASIFLGGAPPEPPPAPLQPPAYTVLPSQPWLSGYNRGQQVRQTPTPNAQSEPTPSVAAVRRSHARCRTLSPPSLASPRACARTARHAAARHACAHAHVLTRELAGCVARTAKHYEGGMGRRAGARACGAARVRDLPDAEQRLHARMHDV